MFVLEPSRTRRGFVAPVTRVSLRLNDNEAMSGIHFVIDENGRKVAVLIDLKKHGTVWEDFWDGLVSESRRKEASIPYETYRATRLKRTCPGA